MNLEVCQLVGIFPLSHLTELINQNDVGLYRDDGLIVVKNLNGQPTDKLRKNIFQVFKNLKSTEIKINLSEADFLDVTFSLIEGTFRTFRRNISFFYTKKATTTAPTVKKITAKTTQVINKRNDRYFGVTHPATKASAQTSPKFS